eukprot:6172119-Pleurochrysis_carterae.AAC.1
MAQQMQAMQEQMQANLQAHMKQANAQMQAQLRKERPQQHESTKQALCSDASQPQPCSDASQPQPCWTRAPVPVAMPSTPLPQQKMGARSEYNFTETSAVSHGGRSSSSTPPDLVSKRQTLSGLLAVHAADPTCAARAGMIAEL